MNSFKHYLFVLAISLLPLASLFTTPLMPHTHDGPVHLARLAAYFKALSDGQILPRWAGDLNYGYGLPLFNFIYHTPYLIGSFFLAAGLGLVVTFKLVVAISFLLSGISMLAFAREFFKDNRQAMLVTVFYQFAPFRLVEISIRGSLGEIYTYSFLPLVLWGLVRLVGKPSGVNLTLTALAIALLIISHNSISLVFFLAAIILAILLVKNVRQLTSTVVAFIFGLALAAFYWLPAVFEHQYTYGDLFMKDVFLKHFPPLLNFFLPNFTNSQTLLVGDINVQLGLFHILGLTAAVIYLFRHRKEGRYSRVVIFSLLATILSLFFMSPASSFIWKRIALLRQFQFPWRFLSLAVLSSSLSSAILPTFAFFKKKFVYTLLLVLTIFSTSFYWRPPLGFDSVNENYFWNYPLNTTYFGETDVIWSAGPPQEYPKARVEIIEGQGTISDFVKKTTVHTFKVSAQDQIRLVDRTQYFPGWRVYVDDQKVPVEFQDANWRGLITFAVPQGSHQIKVIFEGSKIQVVGKTLSILALAVSGLLIFLPRFRASLI